MGSGKKDMASGGGGHSSTLLINRPLKATSPHLVSALKAIWASLVPPPPAHDTLSLAEFTSFLRTTQQEPDSAIPRILADVLPPGQSHVAYPDFERYMCTPHANILRLPGKKSDEDESHPLAEYFISSSHNTYLVGHQLYGDSTTAGYINVLRRGCRCIEIDVWDGDGGEPEVFHGWTLTKEISFVDVCKAIREHAFWSDAGEEVMGPVVISLECHCTAKQQERMVQIMKEVWRGLLVEQPICGAGSVHEVHRVPTLKELKGKILVKTKYHPPDPAAADVPHNLSQLSLTSPSTPKRSKPDPSTSNRPSSSSSTSSEDSSSDEELLELARLTGNRKPPKPKITRSLSNLAIYVSATHFPGTFTPPVPFRATTVFSFSEKVFASHLSTFPQDLPAHNLTRFMRVYPFGLRFSSSNADPTVFWRRGVQLVALNWQKTDAGMMLNEGMFAGEGGYVLKPPHFRPGPGNTPPPAPPPRRKIDFEIEVLAAQDLPLPDKDDRPSSFEPYLKVELHLDDPTPQTSSSSSSSTTSSGDIDPENIKSRTRKAANKGTSATWTPPPKSGKRFSRKIFSRRGGDTGGDGEGEVVLGEEGEKKKSKRIGEVVKFRGVDGVRDPAMCFLRVKVHDEEFGRDDLAGWGCWRMDRVRRGWRVVRLFDRGGRGSEGVVLVRVGWRVV